MALVISLIVDGGSAKSTVLTIVDDARAAFLVEPFCFDEQGSFDLRVTDFVQRDGLREIQPQFVGFIVRRADNPQAAFNPAASTELVGSECMLSKLELLPGDITALVQSSSLNFSGPIGVTGAGFYTIIYANCAAGTTTTFSLSLQLTNAGGQSLPAGDVPLPLCLAFLALAFLLALVLWVIVIAVHRDSAHR